MDGGKVFSPLPLSHLREIRVSTVAKKNSAWHLRGLHDFWYFFWARSHFLLAPDLCVEEKMPELLITNGHSEYTILSVIIDLVGLPEGRCPAAFVGDARSGGDVNGRYVG